MHTRYAFIVRSRKQLQFCILWCVWVQNKRQKQVNRAVAVGKCRQFNCYITWMALHHGEWEHVINKAYCRAVDRFLLIHCTECRKWMKSKRTDQLLFYLLVQRKHLNWCKTVTSVPMLCDNGTSDEICMHASKNMCSSSMQQEDNTAIRYIKLLMGQPTEKFRYNV